ncbi:MAG: FGGY-family carbohydrate kinase, partial [Anaerotignaceae bacterium]
LPYLMGERSPILDEKARGVFFGLSASHKKGDIIRSLLEGVTYSQRSCYDVLKEMGITSTDMMICGGGARSEFWRQMLADLLGCTVKTANVSLEGPALGVAILAGVGSGVYKDLETACDTIIKADTAIIPDSINSKKYNKFYNLYNNLYPTLKGSFAELQQLGD